MPKIGRLSPRTQLISLEESQYPAGPTGPEKELAWPVRFQARLTGGMSGTMIGLLATAEGMIKGLNDHERLLKLAERAAESGEN